MLHLILMQTDSLCDSQQQVPLGHHCSYLGSALLEGSGANLKGLRLITWMVTFTCMYVYATYISVANRLF